MSNGAIIVLMTVLFLGFGYMGVPVAFALIAGVFAATRVVRAKSTCSRSSASSSTASTRRPLLADGASSCW